MSKRGKKRVVFSNDVRFRRIRVIIGDISVDLTTDATSCDFGCSIVEQNEYEMRFLPPLSKAEAANSHIQITHNQSLRRDTCLVVLPTCEDKQLREVEGNSYLSFPSHAVRFTADCLYVDRMYVTLTNEQINPDNQTPIYVPSFRYTLPRFHPLEYYPPIDYSNTPMDATRFPQRMSMKFKKSNFHSHNASAVPKILGWYGTGEDRPNPHRLSAMRFGVMREMVGVALYLHEFPNRQIYQASFYESARFKTQPDGLVDSDGIIEIKCSRGHCCIEGPHVAQSVANMAACNRQWVDILKYCETQVLNVENNTWVTRKTYRIARIERDSAIETELYEAIETKDSERLERLRNYFNEVAATATSKTVEKDADNAIIDALSLQKKQYYALQALDTDSIAPKLAVIEERQGRIFAYYNEGANQDMGREIREQIHSYLDLMTL
jgi:hypothetical protein